MTITVFVELLPIELRCLVYEFGSEAVARLIADGYRDPIQMRALLLSRLELARRYREEVNKAWRSAPSCCVHTVH